MSDLDNILNGFNNKYSLVKNKDELQTLKSEYFGKNGSISLQFKKWAPQPRRKKLCQKLNEIKDKLTFQIEKI